MYVISHVYEIAQVTDAPKEVIAIAENIVTVLDREYGKARNPFNDDGGYVIILTLTDEISALKDIELEVESLCPEYTDTIKTSTGIDYIHALILLNNEFSLHILMEKDKAPENLLD